jgi:hypothetical protein
MIDTLDYHSKQIWVACEIDKLMLPQAKHKDDDPNESCNICRICEPCDEQIHRPGVINTKISMILDTNCSSMLLKWRLGDPESGSMVIPNRCEQTYAYLSIENAIRKIPYSQYPLGLGKSIGESYRHPKKFYRWRIKSVNRKFPCRKYVTKLLKNSKLSRLIILNQVAITCQNFLSILFIH